MFADDWLTVYQGDCRAVMASMEPESVHCVVTSPPYFGLRDYGTPGQLGLERTVDEYVASLVDVFQAVRRVMRKDATLWLNLGDSFGEKQMLGVPWRVAFALQADGWYLRSDIIWSKLNPMPESVTDRPTKSHEYVFLLSKRPTYYFDADAVREPASVPIDQFVTAKGQNHNDSLVTLRNDGDRHGGGQLGSPGARNIRSVWTIATQPYPGAHFATFPRKLVEPCIKAGTSERGVCPECGAPWERVVERGGVEVPASQRHAYREDGTPVSGDNRYDPNRNGGGVDPKISRIGVDQAMPRSTTGWRPSCAHDAEPIPATCLDPFAGSGTTGLVAQSLSRRAILIDLNPSYLMQALERNRDIPLGLVG